MLEAISFINEIQKKYPAPLNNKTRFDINDIQLFEKALGVELPSDYYDFLQVYGYGSFDDYFYILNPFIDNGTEIFIENNKQEKENYEYLEQGFWSSSINGKPAYVDCKFLDKELIISRGNEALAEFLRTEKIDEHTRSKILALGNHYPYELYPEDGGFVYFGRTDDDSFFVRICGTKTSVVMYSDGYYEFDMSITEFIYEYLTKTMKLPMMNDEDEWSFVSYD